MSDTAAFPEWVLVGGMILAALLAAAAVLGRTVRGRAWAMLGALILTPVLLVAEIWDSPQVETARAHGAPALAAAGVGVVAMAGLAWLFARRPGVFCLLGLAALPFPGPGEAGGAAGEPPPPLC